MRRYEAVQAMRQSQADLRLDRGTLDGGDAFDALLDKCTFVCWEPQQCE
jgi:hypothetical protein